MMFQLSDTLQLWSVISRSTLSIKSLDVRRSSTVNDLTLEAKNPAGVLQARARHPPGLFAGGKPPDGVVHNDPTPGVPVMIDYQPPFG